MLEWPRPGTEWRMPERHMHDDWREHDWGVITTQDYENMARVQQGMKSRGFTGLRLNPRQESNLLHMQIVSERRALVTGLRSRASAVSARRTWMHAARKPPHASYQSMSRTGRPRRCSYAAIVPSRSRVTTPAPEAAPAGS